jgi:RNA polymerase sigma factor for flagellar operon FliA
MEKEKLIGTDEEEQALWQRWAEKRNPELRNELFFFYGRWARMIAGMLFSRYPHPLAEWGDYQNLTSIGLLNAIDHFEPERGTQFKTYAEHYIKGSVLKGLACYIQDAPATESRANYVAESLDADGEADLEAVANAVIDLAFGYFLELGVIDDEQQQNDPSHLYAVSRGKELFEAIIRKLPVVEQRVIFGHYYHHLSFTEISEALRVSKSRVSQIHSKALQYVKLSLVSLE